MNFQRQPEKYRATGLFDEECDSYYFSSLLSIYETCCDWCLCMSVSGLVKLTLYSDDRRSLKYVGRDFDSGPTSSLRQEGHIQRKCKNCEKVNFYIFRSFYIFWLYQGSFHLATFAVRVTVTKTDT